MYKGPALASRTSPMRNGSAAGAPIAAANAAPESAAASRETRAPDWPQCRMPLVVRFAAELPDASVLLGVGPARVFGIEDQRPRQVVRIHQPAQFRLVDGPARNLRTAGRSLLRQDESFPALKRRADQLHIGHVPGNVDLRPHMLGIQKRIAQGV